MMFGGGKFEANISFLYFWLGGLVRKLGEGNVKFVWGTEVVLIFEVIFILRLSPFLKSSSFLRMS